MVLENNNWFWNIKMNCNSKITSMAQIGTVENYCEPFQRNDQQHYHNTDQLSAKSPVNAFVQTLHY